MRHEFVEQWIEPIFYAFLEEAFDRGYLVAPAGAPGFDLLPGAYVRARWIGPGRGIIDPLKEANASTVRLENLTTNWQIECAEQGNDYEEVFEQIAIENDLLTKYGLSRQSVVNAAQSIRSKPENTEVETDEAEAESGEGAEQAARDAND
jgi:capsid protein